ncbi:hypothetical protein GY45DRAFT_1435507 [Cubamyces sp. BRFM 1775]|nr:hypothetical protein GY45DRAFT_1435507 [Cubamyces sp. BRFM 1775]
MTDTGRNTKVNNTSTDPNHTYNDSGGGGRNSQKLKGAAEVIHGLGDNLRGRLMSTVDSRGAHPEIEKGRREVEQGMAKLTGGPGVDNAMHGSATRSADVPPTTGGNSATTAARAGSAPIAQQGNTLGPSSAIMAGFNAGPTTAMAEAPYQQQYPTAGTAGTAGSGGGVSAIQPEQASTDRYFYPRAGQAGPGAPTSQQGATPGPAPDHNTLAGDPQRLG